MIDIATLALLGTFGAANVPEAPGTFDGARGASGQPVDGRPYATDAWYGYAWIDEHAPTPFVRLASSVCWGAHERRTFPYRTFPGHKALSFQDDWYDRLHINPTRVDLADLVWPLTLPITLWNAWFEPRTIVSIEGLGEDLIVSDAPPIAIAPLGLITLQIGGRPDSKAVLETDVDIILDNGTVIGLVVTINRVIVWGFTPNWADGVQERLSWATDVLASESMTEQRRALRSRPRQEFEAEFIVDGNGRQFLDLALFAWGANEWAIPLWPDVQWLDAPLAQSTMNIACRTDDFAFQPGGLAVLIGETPLETETIEIDTVTADGIDLRRAVQHGWPRATRLYPALVARLAGDISLTRQTDTLYTFEAKFIVRETSDIASAAPATTYRGRPVLEQRSDETETLTRTFERLIATLDSGLAASACVTNVGERAMPVTAWRWFGMGRAAHAGFRSLIWWLAGRQRAVWIPTWADDLTVTQVQEGGNVITVAWVGFVRFARFQPGRRDIRIELTDGRIYYRRIIDAQETSSEWEALYLDTPLTGIVATQIAHICWMSLSRNSSDEIAIEHLTDGDGLARAELIFRGVRDDEF